jgi:hypothetical protein
MMWPNPSKRLAQLERLDRWCLKAPAWKRHFAAAALGIVLVIPSVILNLWLLPRDRACVVEFGTVVCVDLRSGEVSVTQGRTWSRPCALQSPLGASTCGDGR